MSMGVYIKGMEMPTRCYTCPCADLEFLDCNLMPGTRIEQHKRLDYCPLVPVPLHGRLIDADELPWYLKDVTEIVDAHTIIEAEEDGE